MKAKRLSAILGAFALLVVGGTTLAFAAGDDRPRTDAVAGTFSMAPVDQEQRICEGPDGPYLELTAQYRGTMTGDPRLSGELRVAAHLLINLAKGLGTDRGTFEVRDTKTGRKKAHGRYEDVLIVTGGVVRSNGVFFGEVREAGGLGDDDDDDAEGGSARVIAHYEGELDPVTGSISGQYGGSGDPRTPAVIQGGRCAVRSSD